MNVENVPSLGFLV